MIGRSGERGSGIFVLAARHDDDDDDDDSIQRNSFICIQFNGSKYYNVILLIQFLHSLWISRLAIQH